MVRELPEDWEEMAAWSEKLGVDYCGERLPGLAYKVFQSLLKASRRTPNKLEITPLEGGGRALESRFSRTAWEQYVETPRPPPLVWQPH